MNEKRQGNKLVGYLAASLPASNATPNYDSYMKFKKIFTDECKTKKKNIPSWRKIKGDKVDV